MTNQVSEAVERERLRAQVIHGLRMKGWSRMDAEDEANERLARLTEQQEPPNDQG